MSCGPNRWEERKDDCGRVFYVDHNTQTTSLHKPTAESVYKEWMGRDLSDQRYRHQQRFLPVRSV